ncbi:MAG: hypothetical protein JXB00_17675 [Bacteroidales bacterium]|nr:hypothetical protein [Bacteroidales bacterium]
MKALYITGIILLSATCSIFSQDIDSRLSQAKSSYKSGDLDGARTALQEALKEVNMAIGKEILALLPETMKEMAFNKTDDDVNVTGTGFSGLYIGRSFGNSETGKSARIEVITDSPLLAGVNAILSLPAIMTSSDSGQKRIKVGNYKALLQLNEGEDGKKSYDVQVPFGNSLLTIHCEGYSETDVTAMANTIPVSKIDEKTR